MGYDSSRDELVQTIGEIEDSRKGRIEVAIWSYDGGPPKIGLSRWITTRAGESRKSPIGRMTPDEVGQVLPLLQEALEAL